MVSFDKTGNFDVLTPQISTLLISTITYPPAREFNNDILIIAKAALKYTGKKFI